MRTQSPSTLVTNTSAPSPSLKPPRKIDGSFSRPLSSTRVGELPLVLELPFLAKLVHGDSKGALRNLVNRKAVANDSSREGYAFEIRCLFATALFLGGRAATEYETPLCAVLGWAAMLRSPFERRV